MSRRSEDYYGVLELEQNASDDDIRKAYRRLAKIWHPDKNPTRKDEADRRFKELSKAYQILSDPQQRRRYDLSRPRGRAADYGGYSSANTFGSAYSSNQYAYKDEFNYDFDKEFHFKSADELYKEFFGDKTTDEALEDFINDPIFANLGLPGVPSSRDKKKTNPRPSTHVSTEVRTEEPNKPAGHHESWFSWGYSKLSGIFRQSSSNAGSNGQSAPASSSDAHSDVDSGSVIRKHSQRQ